MWGPASILSFISLFLCPYAQSTNDFLRGFKWNEVVRGQSCLAYRETMKENGEQEEEGQSQNDSMEMQNITRKRCHGVAQRSTKTSTEQKRINGSVKPTLF